MDSNYYQKQAMETAVYPGQKTVNGVVYSVLGLAGEAGEVANVVKKVLRNDHGKITEERKAKLVDELSDVCWYLASTCEELGVQLGDVMEYNLNKLAQRKLEGTLKKRHV